MEATRFTLHSSLDILTCTLLNSVIGFDTIVYKESGMRHSYVWPLTKKVGYCCSIKCIKSTCMPDWPWARLPQERRRLQISTRCRYCVHFFDFLQHASPSGWSVRERACAVNSMLTY